MSLVFFSNERKKFDLITIEFFFNWEIMSTYSMSIHFFQDAQSSEKKQYFLPITNEYLRIYFQDVHWIFLKKIAINSKNLSSSAKEPFEDMKYLQ